VAADFPEGIGEAALHLTQSASCPDCRYFRHSSYRLSFKDMFLAKYMSSGQCGLKEMESRWNMCWQSFHEGLDFVVESDEKMMKNDGKMINHFSFHF